MHGWEKVIDTLSNSKTPAPQNHSIERKKRKSSRRQKGGRATYDNKNHWPSS